MPTCAFLFSFRNVLPLDVPTVLLPISQSGCSNDVWPCSEQKCSAGGTFFFFFFRILTDQSMTARFNAGSSIWHCMSRHSRNNFNCSDGMSDMDRCSFLALQARLAGTDAF